MSAIKDLSIINKTPIVPDNQTTDDVFITENLTYDDAKIRELQSWKENNVYEEVPYVKQKCISVRWICSLKQTDTGVQPKARLVARGFEESTGNLHKDSPTCSKDTLRVMTSIICQKKWDLKSIDIKTAFLQGETISRDVFLQPPPEAQCTEGQVWKLRKCVYGLSDASMKWYERVKSTMTELQGKMSSVDSALFTWHKGNELQGLIAVHVDDFLWSGNAEFQSTIIPKLRKTFTIGKEESKCFKYLGLNITQVSEQIKFDQEDYINALKPITFNVINNQMNLFHLLKRNCYVQKSVSFCG